jgi:hypothetical protein
VRPWPLVAAGLFASSAATAQQEPPRPEVPAHVAEAERLFEAGKERLAADDWVGACKLFDASVELDEAAPALVKVARCRSREGRPALAIDAYTRALAKEPWPELEQLIKSERRENEALAATLVVRVVDPPAGLQLLRNGVVLPSEALAAPLFADPGTTERFVAQAPGYRTAVFEQAVKSAGQAYEVVIRLEQDLPPPPGPEPLPPPKAPPPKIVHGVDVPRAVGYAISGAGGLALGFSAGFGIQFLVLRDDVLDGCAGELPDGTSVCPADARDRSDDAVAARTRAQVLLGVGGGLAAIGVAIMIFAPDDEEGVSLRLGPGGFSLGGRF